MQKIIPPKLKAGDEVRIIAPSRSLSIITKDSREIAKIPNLIPQTRNGAGCGV